MSTAKVIPFKKTGAPKEIRVAELSDGYTKTANAIQEMKPKLQLSGREWQVLEAIICLTYGWNKKQDRVTNTVISDLTGISDRHIPEILSSLSSRKIITLQKQGAMKIIGVNKVVSEWILTKVKSNKPLAESGKNSPESGKNSPESGKNSPESGKNSPESGDTQYKNKNINKNTTSENPDGFTDHASNDSNPVQQENSKLPAQAKQKLRPGAAIQTPAGDKWGTAEDLKAAEYLFAKVQIVRPTAKTPNWPDWANTIRIMREADGRNHREICELFKFANQDQFWSANIMSPAKLREKWDTLCVKRDTTPAQKHQTTSAMWAEAFADTSWANDLGGF